MMIELVVRGTLGLLWLAVIVLASKWPDGCSRPDAERLPPHHTPGAASFAPSGREQPSRISVLSHYQLLTDANATQLLLEAAGRVLELTG